jgi:hypothetical protein
VNLGSLGIDFAPSFFADCQPFFHFDLVSRLFRHSLVTCPVFVADWALPGCGLLARLSLNSCAMVVLLPSRDIGDTRLHGGCCFGSLIRLTTAGDALIEISNPPTEQV